jgi:hypothetical protein
MTEKERTRINEKLKNNKHDTIKIKEKREHAKGGEHKKTRKANRKK